MSRLIGVLTLALLAACTDADHLERVDNLIRSKLKPIKLENCQLDRLGDERDGGYLLCRNLLNNVEAVYSYGIEGRDYFGCTVSNTTGAALHQYDPFNTKRPDCNTTLAHFHEEGVAGHKFADAHGRNFDSLDNQVHANGDRSKRIFVKMDVEGAEWDTFLASSDSTLAQIQQLVLEIHSLYDTALFSKIESVLNRLSEQFYVVHIHANNYRCGFGSPQFYSDVYEVSFVNKSIAKPSLDASTLILPHPLDTDNNPSLSNCDVTTENFL